MVAWVGVSCGGCVLLSWSSLTAAPVARMALRMCLLYSARSSPVIFRAVLVCAVCVVAAVSDSLASSM